MIVRLLHNRKTIHNRIRRLSATIVRTRIGLSRREMIAGGNRTIVPSPAGLTTAWTIDRT
jgi:hypothetical protein